MCFTQKSKSVMAMELFKKKKSESNEVPCLSLNLIVAVPGMLNI